MNRYMLGIVIWNYGYLGALPMYDVGMTVILKHIFDFKYFH
jgi:hypothetical protein